MIMTDQRVFSTFVLVLLMCLSGLYCEKQRRKQPVDRGRLLVAEGHSHTGHGGSGPGRSPA